MNPQDEIRDEEQLASLLAAADRDAAPPDRAFLDRLRDQSMAAFQAAVSQQTQPQKRGRFMFSGLMRGLAVAALVLIGVGLYLMYPSRVTGPAFGTVVDQVAAAGTLHLKITCDNRTEEVWVRHPAQLRWDRPDGTYKIANADTLWLVDEKANRATTQKSPYFKVHDQQPRFDVLALLGYPTEQFRANALNQRPSTGVEEEGVQELVYHLNLPIPGESRAQVIARVEAATHLLRSVKVMRNRDDKDTEVLYELTVVAYNEPVPDEKFVVSDTLTEDGRIGKVTDAQGVAAVRPVMHERWTPVRGNLLLKPGDWVRTDVRGANAVALRLVKQTGVILGPGSLVELVKPTQIKLLEGQLEVSVPKDATLELLGPQGQKVAVKGTQRYRLDKEKLVQMEKEPLWLKGFKGTTSNESIGELVAKVDGRDVPLTVGYHKVTVDIRDQIARTVIEESFVNHTDVLLEGVFHFPLPQDASISGFGMWIGDNLVEADVVEKQRAREIYETILREKRDPGLLEWSGGNIFKARVYPIFAHSEKRIKITYTQVLPLKGNKYRYSYGLQSEMLQQHPLRELAIDVKVNSVVPLRSVTSPTHPTRNDQTPHSAHVEFHAREYTPVRDFEVVMEVDGKQAEVVLIPHRRGDDGYFMMQLLPPASGDYEREILPDGQPLHLLVLADTSASMDAGQRANQAAFLAALFAALTPKDTINLAACDVDCDWVFEKPSPANADNIHAVRQFLAKRVSLGWTDLDKAFASAFKQCGPGTQVIYLGDGIATTADADPQAFAKRLRRLYDAHKVGTFHAVAPGNSFEPAALKAIAALGGGSTRRITGEQGPTAVALELLGEIAQPALRDVKVEFKGLRTARVYPEQLPNVPDGSQQILLGRYLPDGKNQTGEVVVTGLRGTKPVRFTAAISLKDAEQGNSFIPRLWARMHLDRLLEQGTSDVVKDEIIALSEEYQIITPYTSLLVLETDADRERFKVKRCFQMRDGEKFFAQGRDNANYELTQQQMKRAGNWRLGLRRSVLQQLAALGRDPRMFQAHADEFRDLSGLASAAPMGYTGLGCAPESSMAGGLGGFAGDGPGSGRLGLDDFFYAERLGDLKESGGVDKLEKSKSESGVEELDRKRDDGKPDDEPDARNEADAEPLGGPVGAKKPALYRETDFDNDVRFQSGLRQELKRLEDVGGKDRSMPAERFADAGEFGFFARGRRPIYQRGDEASLMLDTLFPALPAAPGKEKEFKSTWPASARTLAQSLLRTEKLAKLTGGIEILRQTDLLDAGHLSSRSLRLELFSSAGWLTRSSGDGTQTILQWCDEREHGVYSPVFLLGRLGVATAQERQTPPFDLSDYSLSSIERAYSADTASVEPQGKDRVVLVLKHPTTPSYVARVLVDTARHVILSIENPDKGKRTFSDFVEVAGCWWAQQIQTTDDKGRVSLRITQTVEAVTDAVFAKRVKYGLKDRPQVQFLRQPLPSVVDAKRAQAAGKATFYEQFALLLHFARSQQWTRVMDHLREAEKWADAKPGMRWVHSAILHASRRHEELKKRLTEEAARLAGAESIGTDELFLADYLVGQSAGFLQANEMLALLERLQPIYRAQLAHMQAMKRWNQQRVSYLQQTGQADEALRLQKQLALDYPRDYQWQANYAQALANAGEYPEAYAWLVRILGKDSHWEPSEEEALRNQHAQFLDQQGRYAELVDYLAEWVKLNPTSASPYAQYLSALIRNDQVDKANTLIAQWLREGQVAGELAPAVAGRLQAAIAQALGQGHSLYTNRIEERWLAPLAEVALFFARQPARVSYADQIMRHGQFQQSDDCRRVRKTLAGVLLADIDKLTPSQIGSYVEWILPNDPAVEADAWQRIADGLHKRWAAEAKAEVKHQLGQSLVQVLTQRSDAAKLLGFLHLQWREGPEPHRVAYVNQLFDTLLAQPWSAEFEDEAFGLLDKLTDATEPWARLLSQVTALHKLTDRMVEARYAARMKTVEHPEKLTRIELQKKKDDNRRLAREELADRLRKAMGKQPKEFAQWMNIERLYLETILERNLKEVAAECWEYLGAAPVKRDLADDDPGRRLESILRDRYLLTVTYVATRKGADAALVARLLKYIDAGVATNAEDRRWKLLKYQVLVALDRPKELEQALQAWIKADDADNRWRLSLGYVMAEQGRIPEAIKLFEAVQAADELTPLAYRTLADWYMAVNQREQHDRAAVAAYQMMEEYRLSNWISQKLNPWQRGGHLPSELDKEVLLLFQALFEKSAAPQNYLWQLQQFYGACRDFRLLSGLVDAVVGHSAAKVYPFIGSMQGVLNEVRDEAVVDEMSAQLEKVRARAKTVVDLRALDLLELQIRRRAAEVKNQPGPHVAAALAAMQRAFKREWSPGEPRLMADFLANLGAIGQPALSTEQLRELDVLHRAAKDGTFDRLHIAHRFASTLNMYTRTDEAIDLLQAALNEFQAANNGSLPVSANEPLATLVSFLEGKGHYARGEKVLLDQLQQPFPQQRALWLTQRLYQLYTAAVQNDGEVSLGNGAMLYKAVEGKIQADFATTDQNHRYNLLNQVCSLYRTAHGKKLAGVDADLRAFAFDKLPKVLKRQTTNYESVVNTVAYTVHDLLGARDGIAFLLNQIDNEPGWFRFNNQDGWSRHSWTIAQWKQEAKDLGELEERLLNLILKELRRDLESRQQRSRVMYHRQNNYYWMEKEAAFVNTAVDIYSKRKESGAAVQYIADYLYWGVNQPGQAIGILFDAHKQKILDETGQVQLIDFLHGQNRHGESIALLQPLIQLRPDNLEYRTRLMSAYFHTNKQADLLALLKETDTHWHQKDRWNESAMAALAHSCLVNQLFTQSVAYYNELIPLHQRTQPRRGIGNGTLSYYYGELARAYAGLQKTPDAVDAAGGAIVSWGPTNHNRAQALEALKQVLREASDLDGYVAHLDKQNAEIPIVRKAIGQVYVERQKFALAIVQLRKAIEAQPNDAETHRLLLTSYEKEGDNEGLIAQYLQAVQLLRRDIKLYQELGQRYDRLGRGKEAERAYTSIVEVLPSESESHTLLAETRELQNRWPEAIVQWEQVARIRALEPTGLLKLAAAQVHEKQWDEATQTVRKLHGRGWPAQFGDVNSQMRALEQQIELGRKQ